MKKLALLALLSLCAATVVSSQAINLAARRLPRPAEHDTSYQANLLRQLCECEKWHYGQEKVDALQAILCYEEGMSRDCNPHDLPDSVRIAVGFRLAAMFYVVSDPVAEEVWNQYNIYWVKRHFGAISTATVETLTWIVVNYINSGRNAQADQLLSEAQHLCTQLPPSPELDLQHAKILLRRAKLSKESGDLKAAATYFEKAAEIIIPHPNPRRAIYELWFERGALYLRRGQPALAMADFRAAQSLAEQHQQQGEWMQLEEVVAAAYLGDAYLSAKNYATALAYYEKASRALENSRSFDSANEVEILINQSKALAGLGRFAEADRYFAQKIDKFQEESVLSVYGLSLFNQLLFASLAAGRAQNLLAWYEAQCNQAKLYEALDWSEQAVAAFHQVTLRFPRTAEQESNRKDNLLEGAVAIRRHLYLETDSVHHFWQALAYTELSKSVRLREELTKNRVGFYTGVPTQLIEEELEAARREQYFVHQLQLAKTRPIHNNTPEALADSLQHWQQTRKRIRDEIWIHSPLYNQMVAAQDVALELEWTANLAPDQALVTYLVGNEATYALVVGPRGKAFQRIPLNRDSLEILVDSLLVEQEQLPLDDYRTIDQTLATDHLAHTLYQHLLGPIAPLLPHRLLIVPDHALTRLPFSSLRVHDPAHGGWLLERHACSYAYSLGLWQVQQQQQYKPQRKKVLALAPAFPAQYSIRHASRAGHESLRNNADEVRYIASVLPAKTYLGAAATRDVFLRQASRYPVLHLATHAAASTEYEKLAFLSFSPEDSDTPEDRVYSADLYALNLQADLVVLSACETAKGLWRHDTGQDGLARAFTYAGAKSLVTTQWRIADREAAILMGRFYDHLAAGLPKDLALQHAQLDFLASQPMHLRHPFYWAAFVPYGDMSPLNLPPRSRRGYYLLGLLGLVALAGGWRLRQAARAKFD